METKRQTGIPLNSLIIDDSIDDVSLVVRHLERGGYALSYRRVDSAPALIAALEERQWDIVFGDYTIPGFSGTAALSLIRERGFDMPFIFISGTIGEDIAVSMMHAGAQDYIMKGNLVRLLPAVQRELRDAATRRERKEAQDRISYLAHHDVLTGLANRARFVERLAESVSRARARRTQVGVAFIDIDRFKNVNDSLGHAAGDQLLKAVADRLQQCMRRDDIVARLSGDEFTVLLADIGSPEVAERVARKILNALALPVRMRGRDLYVSASIGVALFPQDAGDAESLISHADMAMYRAKELGRNNFQFYTLDMVTNVTEKLSVENALRFAIERDELLLHYQPIVDFNSGAAVGAEALIRWQRPDHGLVEPARFIGVAEESALILPIGRWALQTACAQASAWTRESADSVLQRMSINLSPRQFRDATLADSILEVLRELGMPPERLELEITESVLMQDLDETRAILNKLRTNGVSLALDDFGTGYSSLSYLKRFPVDRLKIDRSFIKDIVADADTAAIVHAIIAMAHRLKINVVAEGIETAAQYALLRAAECDFAQGFYLGEPLPAAAFRERRTPARAAESF